MKRYFVQLANRDFELFRDADNISINGESVQQRFEALETNHYQLTIGRKRFDILDFGYDASRNVHRIAVDGNLMNIEIDDEKSLLLKAMAAKTSGSKSSSIIAAPMPGRIVKVLVEQGATVEHGQGVVILEAMKMENELRAQTTGTVQLVKVQSGQTVEKGDILMEIL